MGASKKVMDKVSKAMHPLTELDSDEFDEAVMLIATMALGTINKTKGRKFYKGFLRGAIADPSDVYIEQRPTTRH